MQRDILKAKESIEERFLSSISLVKKFVTLLQGVQTKKPKKKRGKYKKKMEYKSYKDYKEKDKKSYFMAIYFDSSDNEEMVYIAIKDES